MPFNGESSQDSAQYVSNLVVQTIAPVVQKILNEMGQDGMTLLGTSVTTAGIALLKDTIGEEKTCEFLEQIAGNMKKKSPPVI